ncbi:MAG: aminopeptidase P N-terminal domain-containing protein [Pseudomonadota bacterium]
MLKSAYQHRRARLMQALGTDCVAIIPTATEQVRNKDTHFPFRPGSDFYYLTGFNEPEAVLVLVPGRSEGEVMLFCRENDAKAERWEGRRTGLTAAVTELGVDQALPWRELDQHLPKLLGATRRLFYDLGTHSDFDQRMLRWVSQVRQSSRSQSAFDLLALSTHLHAMRLRKDPDELATMRRAAKLSAVAHVELMRQCRPGMYEYELAALFAYQCQSQGAQALAYPSIVAGGEHACVLHYVANNAPLQDSDLILVDAGGELDGYAADITRTFPVNGRFSEPQRQLYELVLAAQTAAIAQVQVGQPWDAPHQAAVRVLAEGLLRLGLLRGSLAQVLKDKTYQRFFMHRTSHWLGLDVHDVGAYAVEGQPCRLEPGMVLTIEPGLYIPSGSEDVAACWQGIGIRIEDDVVVGQDGPEVISAAVPKTVSEIEALMVS